MYWYINVDVCKEGARLTVQINMTFPVNPKRMLHGHTISNRIHSFGKYTNGSKLDLLRRSNVSWHVEFMTVRALLEQK